MNYSTAVFVLNDNVRAIKVIYEPNESYPTAKPSPTEYVFKTLDHTIEKDDLVVIPTSTRFGFTIGKVTETNVAVDTDSPTQLKWIAGVFDPAGHTDTLAMEANMIAKMQDIEKNKKRRELRAAMTADAEEAKILLASPMAMAAAT
jgi:hypothetical protein